MTKDGSAEATIRDIKRKTRRKDSAEEKIRIVVEGLRGEVTTAELCRREGIAESLYYSSSKAFMEAGQAHWRGTPNGRHPAARWTSCARRTSNSSKRWPSCCCRTAC